MIRSLAAAAIVLATVAAVRAEDVSARDVWIVDGDTVDLVGPPRERIRLVAIDAPETWHPHCDAEAAMGREAKEAAIVLLRAGRTVTVTRSGRKDVYGRTLADIAIDGQDLGAVLLERGLALRWTRGSKSKSARIRHWCGSEAR